MNLARYQNIVAIKTASGKILGFHARNMQAAQLDDLAWKALTQPDASTSEAEEELNTWNSEVDPDVLDANIPQEIRSLTVNIAQVCNLKCSYCAAGGDGSYGDPMKQVDLTVFTQQLRFLLKGVSEGGAFRIIFLGGEPLVAPEAIRAIVRFVALEIAGRDIHVGYGIVTNGTLVNAEIAELLASFNCHVTVSLDGPPEINDRNRPTRGGLGSTERTIRGIEQLQKVRDRLGSLSAGAVFGKHHTGVADTYLFLKQFEFDSIKIDFAAGDHDDEASQNYVTEVLRTADLAFTSGGEKELRKLSLFETYFRILDSQTRIHNHCGAGKSHLQVDTRGRFSICQWMVNDPAEEVGHGTELDREKLKAYADPLIELNDCKSCWVRHLCGGGCMMVHKLKTGSKHQKDTDFCTRTRSIIAKGIEYYVEARYQNGQGE
jgi:uncharacterized protein